MHPVLEDLKKQLVNSYQVQAVPTLMLFKAGKMVWRQSGAMQATQIRQVIGKYLYQCFIFHLFAIIQTANV